MARRNDHSREQLQDMAIQATRDIILHQGFEGVSARKVASSIGYTVGTLYQCFDGIPDLVLHANGITLDKLLSYLEQAIDPDSDSSHNIEQVALAYLSFAQKHENLWHAIFKLSLPQQQSLPDWYRLKIEALFLLLANILDHPNCQNPPQETAKAARALWASVHGISILYVGNKLFSEDIATAQELIQSVVRNYMNSWIQPGNAK